MREYDRKRLLERIDRAGATVGATIPDEVDLDGEPFPLQSFVFETKRLDTIDADRRSTVDEVKRRLRRAKQRRIERIEAGQIDRDTGERLATEVIGIERALNELESLEPTDLEATVQAQETADRKRWLTFLDRALGRDSDRNRRGGHG